MVDGSVLEDFSHTQNRSDALDFKNEYKSTLLKVDDDFLGLKYGSNFSVQISF